jgi:hypothetical protein
MPETDLLAPLRRFYPAHAPVSFVSAETLPAPERGLLVHDGDMTSRLGAHHGSAITLEAHEMTLADGFLHRVSILRRGDTGAAVEFGAIRIALDGFAAGPRGQIERAELPLGAVLVENAIPFTSHPGGFFAIGATAYLTEYLGAVPGQVLYGRCNQLRHDDGRLLADVVEILPPVSA